MAEQEIIYIPYGDQQMEQAPFMRAIADNVQDYVNQQTWSSKRKQKFLDAYSDIVSKGITGASNNSGQWAVDLSGNLDLESKSKKDQEMYHEAAYYILQQMKGIPTKQSQAEEEEAKKKDLQLYDNSWHQKAFTRYIGNNMFGGRNWDYTKDWDVLDERDKKTGILGTSGRMAKLADMLEGYSNSLEEGKYNFEGTAFRDLADLKGRIGNTVASLRNGVFDQSVKDSLNAIGLNWRDYLHDGSDDTIQLQDGTTITRGEYLEALQQQEADAAAAKAAQEKQDALAKQKANAGVLNLVSGIHAVEARSAAPAYADYLANQYGVGQEGYNNINTAIQGLIEKGRTSGLTTKEKKQLGNLLYYVRTNNPNYQKSNITDQEWKELSAHKNLGSQNRAGFVRLPWQTSDGRYTFADDKGNLYFLKPKNQQKLASVPITRSAAYNQYKQNFLKNTNTTAANEAYLKQQGFTNADIAELGGIAADIASIIDPEPFSAAGLGLAAAGARNYARTQQPKKWTFGDYVTQAFDYVTGAIGAIPILGDAALATKTAKNVAKWGKRIMTIPAIWDMASHAPGATTAIQKAINGENLTVEDWRNLGSFVRGLTATRNITVQNRAGRKALEKRGYDLSNQNSIWKRSGIWDTSAPTHQTTVKVKVKGKEEEIPISAESKQKLDEKLKKAGNNQDKKDAAIREVQEVKDYVSSKSKTKLDDVAAIEHSAFRNARYVPRQFGTTRPNYGTKENTSPVRPDNFEAYLNSDRGVWDRIKYGSNTTLRRMDRFYGLNSTVPTTAPSTTTASTRASKVNYLPDNLDAKTSSMIHNAVAAPKYKMRRMTPVIQPKNSTVNGKLIDGSTFQIQYGGSKSGEMVIVHNGTPFKVKGNLHSQKKRIGQWIERQNQQIAQSKGVKLKSSNPEWKDFIATIKDLKRKGYLFKQGGTIQQDLNTIISNFLKTQI